MEKKISVVIPTYRRPELLSRCIKALVRQHFDINDYEIIIVSDGPDKLTDSALARRLRTQKIPMTHIQPAVKKGPAAARNLGWLQAKGKLIAFTDDDCIPDPDWLKTIWQAWNGEEEIAFSGKVVVPISGQPTDYELNISNLERAEFVTANCACTKQALIKTGGFDERFTAAWREDSDLQFKFILQQIPIRQIPAVVVHPVRKAPWGISLKEEKKGIFNALLYKKYPGLYRRRINSKAPWNYYACIVSFSGLITGIIAQSQLLILLSLFTWTALVSSFIIRRLQATSKSPNHIMEVILTSIAIPFVSVYYQLYGAWKYRVLFI